ncbi:MAG: fused MFS/spermidine synthase [Burkholderiales bacterium]|nr:fused MFS/spermidine synthase [Burkholderiales bacterium]
MTLYALVIMLSALLLFLVQPLIAKLILPWFGGSAAVWATCMLFFQTLLLAGYAYAHGTNARLSPRAQAALHTALLAGAVASLPIAPEARWKPSGTEEPISAILLLLAATIGLPYFLLSATSPLVQAWFARARPGENPYRLFAASNLASLLALVGYPFAVEPWLGGRAQVAAWSWLFAAFALLCALLAWRSAQGPAPGRATLAAAAAPAPRAADLGLWLALSAAGSALLLAVTNHITQNVAAIPLLWLAPLTLYLLTFILAFEGGRFWRPEIGWTFVLVWIGGMAWLLADSARQFDLPLQLGIWLSGLFVACLFCHGELYRLRPHARHLTAFYLAIAAGGALGGLFVAVLAPLAFDAYLELGIALVAVAALAALRFAALGRLARAASLVALVAASGCATYDALRFQRDVVYAERNFYGVLRVKEYGTPGAADHLRRLLHGVILHGEQYMAPERRREPTTYYQASSGIGAALAARAAGPPIRVGVIGLGAGTLAAWGRPGDVYRFYDINPDVVAVARSHFAYLADSAATIEMALGDARLVLEREPPQNFDILAVDAFSSDAIPVHLVTREALALYLRHVKPDGIVAFHVSNRFLDLVPVVAAIARANGAHAVLVSDSADDDPDKTQTDWVLVSRDANALAAPAIAAAGAVAAEPRADWRPWTDDYSNLVQILK